MSQISFLVLSMMMAMIQSGLIFRGEVEALGLLVRYDDDDDDNDNDDDNDDDDDGDELCHRWC